ncbi:Plasmid pRiA4b ORF-3-like protein [Schinkia azotoformans MEV2011]|uniref:Plasmid pRiA4b ORF-3-like protein n=1 Tax=Schinkia azotoformans MEV2011 TaxID=1348973 RepID=A0A072NQ24_SCHAZ|nr:plasmid pRiA4b ORF-3 family protein [Schinkia azotoformans]KEF39352.1 Plasmid pRiA4b ORF-3-like protein [Schinkia azotoformans MEV2011]MEC1694896.1 plasmid pRiA4b ORF-3 family protein [Schinkia azotoformans]MEC1725507.1 plasmid pRiA4b ORF-3 family protein [Schinkia azotoformans]MEC1770674.1 plasmid pRiA4b ORF-3 family protein [Schinkia azotoformans]MEC1778153.1 plasmid pRiA4b ORF-3 family protein [Schinkia azotoformans]
MIIQCTKSLLDKVGIKGNELASSEGHEQFPDSLMAWHANFVSINRRKAIILMNNETRYPIVIYRPSIKDFSKIKELIREAIMQALRMEGVRKEVIEAYLDKAGEISFSKTSSRSMVAKMNNTVREIEFMGTYLDEEAKIQRYISLVVGRLIQISGSNEGFYPFEKMLEYLGSISGIDIDEVLDIDLYQLKIQINIEGHDIWRRVLVPATYSFRHLHNIIQTVFDWQNYHLHEFVVERAENKPIKILMDDDPETLEYINIDEFDVRQERFVALEDIFPEYNEVMYEYDFGDAWEHTVTLEKVVKSKTFQATYLDGNGERPPEDVGGAGGFEEYLRIMDNEKHPRHQDIKAWAESQKERKLGPEKINQRLNRVTSGSGFSTIVI